MKKVLLFALVLGFTVSSQAAVDYLRLNCQTDGTFPAQSRASRAQLFLILKKTGKKIDLVTLNEDEYKVVDVKPARSALSALNENTSIKNTAQGVTIRGDSDGFYLVNLTLTAASGYMSGYASVSDTGEGFGNGRVGITCEQADAPVRRPLENRRLR